MLRLISRGGLFVRSRGECRRIVQAGEVDLLACIADGVRVVLATAPQRAEITATPAADMPVDWQAIDSLSGLYMGLHGHNTST